MARGVKYTLESWKEKANQVHNGKYTYERVTEYTRKEKCEIYCTECKVYFKQTLQNHIRGRGHYECSHMSIYKKDKNSLITNFKNKHGDLYDYSRVIYKGFDVKVEILCKEHGIFRQTPHDHLAGKGCWECGVIKRANTQRKTKEVFITEMETLYPNQYDLSDFEYKGAHHLIKLLCKKCNTYSLKKPNSFLLGRGCKTCHHKNIGFTYEEFKKELNHETKEDYEFFKDTYKSISQKMKVIHKKCGHTYYQSPSNVLHNNQGCPICKHGGFNVSKKGLLYYLEVTHNNEKFYKIGITNNTIKDRYSNRDLEKITNQITFPMLGQKAWDWEKAIIKEYKEHLYKGDDIILDSAKGNAELFTKDILGVFNGY